MSGQTVRHKFVNYDDGFYVYDNPHISGGLTAHGMVWVFTHSHGFNWHPLTGLSHMLDCQFYGRNAGGHHLTNVLLQAATVILLFLVLWRMTGALWPSALVAAIFAVHPLRVESVAWISERKDVLSGFFFVVTLSVYVRYVRSPFSLRRYLLLVVVFALGLMAKAMLVTLPLVLLLLDYWPLARMAPATAGETAVDRNGPLGRFSIPIALIIEKLPLLLLAVVSCLATLWAQGEILATKENLPLYWRVANALVSCVAYLGQLFCPVRLAVFYPYQAENLPVWKVAGAAVVLACIAAGALFFWRRYPYWLVGWLWYLGMLVPVIGLVQVGSQALADRYTYLPQIGLYIALVWGTADVCRSWPYRRWLCGVTPIVVLVALTACAWRQASFWRDSKTLWNHTLACTSQNDVAHDNLGLALAEMGLLDEAMAHYRTALEIEPDDAGVHNHLGNALAGRNRLDEAMAHYRKALAVKPNDSGVHNNLGNILAKRGQFDAAVVHFQRALEINPDDAGAHNNLGNALACLGRLDEATAQYRQALEIRPDYADASYDLGLALAGGGQFDEALVHLQPALKLRPNDADLHSTLGNILAARGQFEEAVAHYHKALEIRPDNLAAQKNLAWLRATCPVASQRNGEEAVELAKRANGRCDGKRSDVLDTLAAAYAEIGWFPEAVAAEGKALELATQSQSRSLTDAWRGRMALYQAGRPFRQPRPASTPPRHKP